MAKAQADIEPAREPKVETRALDRGLQLLTTLAVAPEGLSAPELADINGLNRATVYRLLATLQARNFVVQDATTRRYVIGPNLETWFLGRESRLALAALSKAAMEVVADETGETVGLFVRNHMNRICISRIDSQHVLRHVRELGELRPLVLGSSGIVLMWQLEDAKIGEITAHYADVLDEVGLTDADVRRQISDSRKKGYAGSSNAVPGLASVAVPVVDMAGRIIATLTVTGPGTRFGSGERRGAITHLREAARRISEEAYQPF